MRYFYSALCLIWLVVVGCMPGERAITPAPPTAAIALAPSSTPLPVVLPARTATVGPTSAPTITPRPIDTPAPQVAAVPQGGALDASLVEGEIYDLINRLRAENGLPPLAYSSALATAARSHSCDIAARQAIDHRSADGRTLAERLPQDQPAWEWPSENIAVGFPDAVAVVEAWFNEVPPDDWHRRNILASDQREVGVGYCYNGDGGPGNSHYYTADFSRRAGVYPLVLANGASHTTDAVVPYWLYGEGWAEAMRLGFSADMGAMPWQPFAARGTFRLDGPPGPYTLYAELRGPHGATTLVSATITLK
jgi:uncharacterized protein YkwD